MGDSRMMGRSASGAPSVVMAARCLLSVCDGAHERDGAGFNGPDALAVRQMLSQYALSLYDLADLHERLAKYRRQLAGFGIDYDEIERPADPREVADAHRKVVVVGREPHESTKQVRMGFGRHRGETLYDMATEKVERGRQYLAWYARDGRDPVWRELCRRTLDGEALEVPAGVRERMETAEKARVWLLSDEKGERVMAKFPRRERLLDAVRAVEGRRFDPVMKAWSVPVPQVVALVAALGGLDEVEMDASSRAAYDREVERRAAMEAVRDKEDVPELEVPTRKDLYGYQRVGVAFAVAAGGRACIFDEPGVGKTAQAIGFAEYRRLEKPDYKTLVICPAGGRIGWVKEILRFAGSMATTWEGDGKHGIPSATGDRYHVINYDIVHKHIQALRAERFDLIVMDEVHHCKSGKSIRARAIFGDKKDPASWPGLQSPDALALTGTPILNVPVEAYPVLHYIAPERFPSIYTFKYAYGENGLRRLHEQIKAVAIRRKLIEVQKEMPPVQENDVFVELLARERSLYEAQLRAMFSEWGAAGRPGVVEANRLQRLLTEFMLPRACEMIDEIVASGRKVLVFSIALEPLRKLRARYGEKAIYIDGSMPTTARKREEEAFQEGDAQVACLSIRAAGEMLNLQAASTVIFLNYDWVPAKHTQGLRRAWRTGQRQHVQVYYPRVVGTIFDHMRAILDEKERTAGLVQDGEAAGKADARERSIFAELVEKLREEYPREMRGIGKAHDNEGSQTAEMAA